MWTTPRDDAHAGDGDRKAEVWRGVGRGSERARVRESEGARETWIQTIIS